MSKNLEELKLKFKKHCGFEDEEFEKLKFNLKMLVASQPNISGRGSALFGHIIYTLVDFEKRLTELEKLKDSIESIKRNSIDTIHIGETKNDLLCIGIRKKKGGNKP